MRHPPYHLRPNKAVDRLALIEAIRRLEKLGNLSAYTYYGFGGPYLEDFRLLYELLPGIRMVCIEEDNDTYRCQRFHRPCARLRLRHVEFKSFLAQYQANDRKSIFWLDYTGLEYGHFEDFMILLGKVAADSMIKITLRAEPRDYMDIDESRQAKKREEFRNRFAAVVPDPSADPPVTSRDFACLLQEMLEVAAQKALPGAVTHMFQPVSSFRYSDRIRMFTLTGVVCRRDHVATVNEAFGLWPLANLDWAEPREIDVPILSTKERLHLQRLLPCGRNPGRALRQALGYLIDEGIQKTEAKLEQYAQFHRYSPYFMRATP